MNLMFNRPNLVLDANPTPSSYNDLWAQLGWFSWVYHDRDSLGFSRHIDLLRLMGVDQIVSDIPLTLAEPFQTVQDHYPFVYFLPGTYPKAYLQGPPESKNPENPQVLPILQWDETRLHLEVQGPGDLVVQKTYLPGWKAWDNDYPERPFLTNRVLMGLSLAPGKNNIVLKFEPVSLRLGFFMFLTFCGGFCFSVFRRILA